jgi:hypothetical protein
LALLSLLATSEAVVSGRLDRRLRLVKKPLEASTEAEADSVQLDGTAFIELGDNVHEPRSIQAGTLVPGKDASLPAVDLSTQAAPAAASSTASATATAASSAASASEAKKQRMPGDSLPASLPPSALVDPEVQKKHAAEKAAKQLEKELASLEPDLGDEHDPRITRSKFDRRKYRTFVLPNGLRVLLVSDSKTSRVTCPLHPLSLSLLPFVTPFLFLILERVTASGGCGHGRGSGPLRRSGGNEQRVLVRVVFAGSSPSVCVCALADCPRFGSLFGAYAVSGYQKVPVGRLI